MYYPCTFSGTFTHTSNKKKELQEQFKYQKKKGVKGERQNSKAKGEKTSQAEKCKFQSELIMYYFFT